MNKKNQPQGQALGLISYLWSLIFLWCQADSHITYTGKRIVGHDMRQTQHQCICRLSIHYNLVACILEKRTCSAAQTTARIVIYAATQGIYRQQRRIGHPQRFNTHMEIHVFVIGIISHQGRQFQSCIRAGLFHTIIHKCKCVVW